MMFVMKYVILVCLGILIIYLPGSMGDKEPNDSLDQAERLPGKGSYMGGVYDRTLRDKE
jgi:hypothetical protein